MSETYIKAMGLTSIILPLILDGDLAANQLPDMTAMRERFAPDPAALPEVVVHLAPLSSYKELLSDDEGDLSAPREARCVRLSKSAE